MIGVLPVLHAARVPRFGIYSAREQKQQSHPQENCNPVRASRTRPTITIVAEGHQQFYMFRLAFVTSYLPLLIHRLIIINSAVLLSLNGQFDIRQAAFDVSSSWAREARPSLVHLSRITMSNATTDVTAYIFGLRA
jgi:hypothetical protein